MDDHNYGAILEYALIVKSEEFDNQFYYSQDDLGPTYTKEVTTFKVWAPTSYKVFLQLIDKEEIRTLEMKRCDKGVYTLKVDGDLDGIYYQYLSK